MLFQVTSDSGPGDLVIVAPDSESAKRMFEEHYRQRCIEEDCDEGPISFDTFEGGTLGLITLVSEDYGATFLQRDIGD